MNFFFSEQIENLKFYLKRVEKNSDSRSKCHFFNIVIKNIILNLFITFECHSNLFMHFARFALKAYKRDSTKGNIF